MFPPERNTTHDAAVSRQCTLLSAPFPERADRVRAPAPALHPMQTSAST
jgi:hypothetical protein